MLINISIFFVSICLLVYLFYIYLWNLYVYKKIINKNIKIEEEIELNELKLKKIYTENSSIVVFNRFKHRDYIEFLDTDYLYHGIKNVLKLNDLDYKEREIVYENIINIKNDFLNNKKNHDFLIDIFDFLKKYNNIENIKLKLNNSYNLKEKEVESFSKDFINFSDIINRKYSLNEKYEIYINDKDKIISRNKKLIKQKNENKNYLKKINIKKNFYIYPLIILFVNIFISIFFIFFH